MNRDLIFLSGRFMDDDLPTDKQYLLRYFKTTIQRQFVRYYLLFGTHDNFADHTGHRCTHRWLVKLARRLRALEEAHRQAKQSLDLTLLAQIESGEYEYEPLGDY